MASYCAARIIHARSCSRQFPRCPQSAIYGFQPFQLLLYFSVTVTVYHALAPGLVQCHPIGHTTVAVTGLVTVLVIVAVLVFVTVVVAVLVTVLVVVMVL